MTVDAFEKEVDKNLEFEDKMKQADSWMERKNRRCGLMMDWFNAEDKCKETKEKKKQCRSFVVHKGEMRSFGRIDLEPEPEQQMSEVVAFLLNMALTCERT